MHISLPANYDPQRDDNDLEDEALVLARCRNEAQEQIALLKK